MPPDHCHPAKSGYLYSGADKTRLEKNEDIRKIVKILFNESEDSGYEKALFLILRASRAPVLMVRAPGTMSEGMD